MTYKEIVDRVRNIAERHKMIVDFGYGALSDIKTNGDDAEADYPYVFLNPTNHTRTGQSITYRFNMIVMAMAYEHDFLTIQSEAQQYIDDILSELRFGYSDQVDLTLNVSLTPFKERFQDTVAGMTASLEIIVPQKLDQCIAPFVGRTTTILEAEHTVAQTIGSDPGENKAFQFSTVSVNVDNQWNNVNRFTSTSTQTTRVTVNYSFQFEALEPGEVYPGPPQILFNSIANFIPATTTTGWPTTPASGVTYTVEQVWENLQMVPGDYSLVYLEDDPDVETEIVTEAGKTIKIEKYI